MNETFKKILSHSAVQITIVLGGVAITLVNAWIAFKLAPLAENIRDVAIRVSALETVHNEDFKPLVNNYSSIYTSVQSIDRRIDRIENKVDTLLQR